MDNQAGIAIACMLQPRAPHKDEAHRASSLLHIRELVEQQRISVPFVKTTDNWADFFTKPLTPKHFTAMRNAINLWT